MSIYIGILTPPSRSTTCMLLSMPVLCWGFKYGILNYNAGIMNQPLIIVNLYRITSFSLTTDNM